MPRMDSYHIRTREKDKHDPMGLSVYTLDSIYVPDKTVLVGIVKQKDLKVMVINYSKIGYCKRAQQIVDGNRYGVQGIVVGEPFDLEEKVVQAIALNKHGSVIKLPREYDDSTKVLVEILSGKYTKRDWKAVARKWLLPS
ncbi:MAG: hypothetical protein ABII01_04115 [Candidatus Woesearchaeota archaeon]